MSIVEHWHRANHLTDLGNKLDKTVVKPLRFSDRVASFGKIIDEAILDDGWDKNYFYGRPITEELLRYMWQGHSRIGLVYKQTTIDNGFKTFGQEFVYPTKLHEGGYSPPWQLLDLIETNGTRTCPPGTTKRPNIQYELVGIATQEKA